MRAIIILSVILFTQNLVFAGVNPMIMNLAPVTDWSTESVFRDEFKMSRNWVLDVLICVDYEYVLGI